MSPNELTESSWRAAAFHEAGHAIVAYYYGCTVQRIRIFEDHGSIRGDTTVNRDSHYEAAIVAAGRAEAFGFPQTDLDKGRRGPFRVSSTPVQFPSPWAC
jgi:hypothetical protein